MAAPASDACDNSSSTATDSKCPSPASCTPPETPLAPLRLSAANRSLLVRILNRNLAQQQHQDTALQSLSSDPLLNALPAGNASAHLHSYTTQQQHHAMQPSCGLFGTKKVTQNIVQVHRSRIQTQPQHAWQQSRRGLLRNPKHPIGLTAVTTGPLSLPPAHC